MTGYDQNGQSFWRAHVRIAAHRGRTRPTPGAADAVCSDVRLIQHATSLGAVESTIERRASIPGQDHLPPALLRLSVGIENVDDIWLDLDAALKKAR
jgi:cystathionine gamma-synthase